MPITTFRALAKFSAAALLPILLCHTTFAQTTEATTNTVKIPQKANTQVVLETNRGDITLELFDSKTPKTVKNFIGYVKSGFYNDTVFHRVIPGFAIQGGGFSKELAKKKTKKAIKNEATAELKNITGTIAMARLSAPHTATAQFFINLNDNRSLDYREYNPGYAVFGRVSDGMNIVELIAKAKTSQVGMHKNVPIDAIIINSAYILSSTPATASEKPEQTGDTENAAATQNL